MTKPSPAGWSRRSKWPARNLLGFGLALCITFASGVALAAESETNSPAATTAAEPTGTTNAPTDSSAVQASASTNSPASEQLAQPAATTNEPATAATTDASTNTNTVATPVTESGGSTNAIADSSTTQSTATNATAVASSTEVPTTTNTVAETTGTQPSTNSATAEATAQAAATATNTTATASSAEPSTTTNAPAGATAAASAGATNVVRGYTIQRYVILGNTLLTPEAITACFTNALGTNISVDNILKGARDLQMAYRERGFHTVNVTLPQQTITNGTVTLQVFEGKLAEILVKKNRYFSTENVMRALPSLQTNIVLNAIAFQAEVDRANANRDRQIYPQIEPGPEPYTTSLTLEVKDRLPLHARIEFNNQSTPGTPPFRLNTSVEYKNLWQYEHSLGLQYGFSPGDTKTGDWNFYDLPLIANYSVYYRMPLSEPESVVDVAAGRPSDFGYDEATHRFRLPPSFGMTELTVFASRSTIDTGIESSPLKRLFTSDTRTIDQQDVHQDLTVNEDFGFRFSKPLPPIEEVRSTFSFGMDHKAYRLSSFATNLFIFTEFLLDENNNPFTRVSETPSPVPSTHQSIDYWPVTFRWDASRVDKNGSTSFGVGYMPNLWYSGSLANLRAIAGSSKASGSWNIVNASLTREQNIPGQLKLSLHVDGQWASEPLISNEQFGLGGLAGVRGYQEGQIYGDTGWRFMSELKSPSILLGMVDSTKPMYLRGSVFLDYGEVYLIDPGPRDGRTQLFGTGFGFATSIGSTWEGRLMLAWPLLSIPQVNAGQTHVYFSFSAQF